MCEVESLEGVEVSGDIFPDGGVGAAAGFDGGNTRSGEGVVGSQELGVFTVGEREGVNVCSANKRPKREGNGD